MEKIDIGGTFKIVGIITSPDFQRCRVYCERLHKSFPEKYPKPNVRGLLNVEWERYITKVPILANSTLTVTLYYSPISHIQKDSLSVAITLKFCS